MYAFVVGIKCVSVSSLLILLYINNSVLDGVVNITDVLVSLELFVTSFVGKMLYLS